VKKKKRGIWGWEGVLAWRGEKKKRGRLGWRCSFCETLKDTFEPRGGGKRRTMCLSIQTGEDRGGSNYWGENTKMPGKEIS